MVQRADVLSAQVYRYLKQEILSGRLAPGEKLVESRLAKEFSTSRTPIREALRMLVVEQLVKEGEGSLRVFEPSYADFYEIYELRLSMEPYAAKLAAARWDEDIALRITDNLQQTSAVLEGQRRIDIIQLNSEFHQCIWEACRNTRIQRMLENVSTLIQYYCLLVLRINQLQTNLFAEHTAIWQAIASGDGELAYQRMQDHVEKDLRILDVARQEGRMQR
ncbi:GntR family transcriptional regulator [Alicyclobacillus tolerans]|uniref:GntR family transcriptional regulator n=1 Tax=Alicyclobacillus TaxID=29330 RepID=UPI002106F5E4|nr:MULTISPECIES: GntR family transcriptional regulator [Alicyclobacillus]